MAKVKLQCRATPIVPADIGLSWFSALEPEFSKEYFTKLNNFVQEERRKHTVYPSHENVFTWRRSCEVNKVKVVILGQDPYHNPGQAHGLAFSVPKGVAIPASLLNMYKELAEDIPGFQRPSHGNLTGWAEQAAAQCVPDCAHEHAQLAQGAGLGEPDRCGHPPPEPEMQQPGLPALGFLRSEERRYY